MDLRSWILETYTPAIMVISSPEAEAMCQDSNGLSVVDLMRPYGFFHHLSVPVRTVGESAYRIKEFRLRFFQSSTMFQPSPEVAEQHLRAVLSTSAEESHPEDAVDLLAALRKGEVPRQTPWFEKYRQEYLRLLGFSELETYDHPVACLLVLHSHAKDPLAAFEHLYAKADLPPLMKVGIMEPRMLRHYLLLHNDREDAEGGLPWAEEKLRALRERLGQAACHLVRINTGSGDPKATMGYEGLWRAHLRSCVPGGGAGEPEARPAVPAQGIGAFLVGTNLEALAHFLEDFTVQALLPHLETRVRTLNTQVLATRRGVRNQIKNLLWRAKSNASELPRAAIAQGPPFGAQSVEGQLRALADLAFMLQDYELCSSTLRLLAADLKADKDWKHYAAAQEMLGLASFMMGGPMTEVASHFREAYARYISRGEGRISKELVRYATRSQLLLAEYCFQHGLYGDANAALMRATAHDEDLRAAVLLEQAALCLLHLDPPGVRKWAFHLVLAGLKFNQCNQPRLAHRAYRQVLGFYQGRQWAFIEEHLQDMLGKQARDSGDLAAALDHFAATLKCPQTTAYWQQHYLTQYMDTFTRASTDQVASSSGELPLPEVDVQNVDVVFDDAITFGSADARALPDAFWKRLAAPILPGQDSGPTWMDGGRKGALAGVQRMAVLGEEICLDVELYNPLALQLHITRLRLSVEEQPSTSGSYKAQEEEVVLRGGERMRVRLRLHGLALGPLKVTGVRWQLEGQAWGHRALQVRQLPNPRARGKLGAAAPDPSISFTIIPAMPRLEVEMEGLEGPFLEGELARFTANIRNVGTVPLRALRLLISHPDLYCSPHPTHQPASPLTSLSDLLIDGSEATAGQRLIQQGVLVKGGGRVFSWPPELTIAAAETLHWTFYLHPGQAGPLTLHCAWHYEPAPSVEAMPWRMLRWSRTLDVLPSLQLRPAILPSPTDLHRCLLRLHASNMQGLQLVGLQEVACSSPGWRLSSLQDTQPGDSVLPALTSSIAASMELPANSQSTLVCQMYPPQPAPATHPAGVRWLQEGAAAYFHADRRRQAAAPPPPIHRSSSNLPSEAQTPGSSAAQIAPLGSPDGQGAAEERTLDLVVSWRVPARLGQPERIGMHHLLACSFQEEAATRALISGERHLRWDFAKRGPCKASFLLRIRNCHDVAAFLCVEAGTSLDLHAPDRSDGGRWHVKPAPDLPSSGASTGSAQGSATPPTASARTSPATTPHASYTPAAAGSSTPAGPSSSADYMWLGHTCSSVPHLEAGATAELQLQVMVFGPGSFQLSDYTLFWTFASGSYAQAMNSAQPGPPLVFKVDSEP